MVQRGSGLGFSLESAESLRILRHVFGQEFQCDKAAKLGVLGFVYDAHPTATEFLDDPVMGNGAANQWLGVRHIAHILGATSWQVNEAKPLAPRSVLVAQAILPVPQAARGTKRKFLPVASLRSLPESRRAMMFHFSTDLLRSCMPLYFNVS
jgi:hypothetical protein